MTTHRSQVNRKSAEAAYYGPKTLREAVVYFSDPDDCRVYLVLIRWNNAFWSLTMGDAGNRFVPNPIHRFSVSDRSGLTPNADGSIDVYIQSTAPPGHEANWLPAPAGNFILWLRVYLPGPTVLGGDYKMPPVLQVS